MTTASRRTIVRAAAVTACAGAVLALPAAAAIAEGLPAAPAAHGTLVQSLSLADGRSTAKVYRIAKDAYQAEVLRDGSRVATLTSRDGAPGVGSADGLHLALAADGHLSSWTGDTAPTTGTHTVAGDGHKTAVRSGHVVVPVSTQALHLDNVAEGPGEGVLLLAAGGGIAAVGAAGLGFAMLRRGRTDG